jgi:hypothetical protein
MKILERLSDGVGTGKLRGIYEEGDGKHYCVQCGKLMRPGQEAMESWGPDTRYRRTNYRYRHVVCPRAEGLAREE